ncbi:type II toxin-antitoxin system RelE family toxin [Nostoc sp.]
MYILVVKHLAGYYRYRIGEYRVIYRIDDETNQLTAIFR